jgi:hypothetical protein
VGLEHDRELALLISVSPEPEFKSFFGHLSAFLAVLKHICSAEHIQPKSLSLQNLNGTRFTPHLKRDSSLKLPLELVAQQRRQSRKSDEQTAPGPSQGSGTWASASPPA